MSVVLACSIEQGESAVLTALDFVIDKTIDAILINEADLHVPALALDYARTQFLNTTEVMCFLHK